MDPYTCAKVRHDPHVDEMMYVTLHSLILI